MLIENNKQLDDTFGAKRRCKTYCPRCGVDEVQLDYRDIKLEYSPILAKSVPKTHCYKCKQMARVVRVLPPNKKEKPPVQDQLEFTDRQMDEKRDLNFKKYKKKYGEKALRRDFLQPYENEKGEASKEFVKAYHQDSQKMKNAYSSQELRRLGMKDLAEEKDKESPPDLVL